MVPVSILYSATYSTMYTLRSDAQLNDITLGLSNSFPHVFDVNTRAGPGNSTITAFSWTVNSTGERATVKERLLDVQLHHAQNLQFALNTLATQVLLCQVNNSSANPTAYGLQVAPNAFLPVSEEFTGKVDLNFTEYYARHEVVVSAGVFQSPQLVSPNPPFLAYS